MAKYQNKNRCLIYIKNTYQKNDVINILQSIGFEGEKVQFDLADKALMLLEHKAIDLCVIEGALLKAESFVDFIETCFQKSKNPQVKILVFSSNIHEYEDRLRKLSPACFPCALPYSRLDFTNALIPKAKPLFQLPVVEKPKKTAPPKQTTINFIETSKHVQISIEMINQLAKDKSKLEELQIIGQRFNGVFGTFSFFGKTEGFFQLYFSSCIIDNICRTYARNAALTSMSTEHFNLLFRVANNAFIMLKELRSEKPLSDGLKKAHVKLIEEYKMDKSIYKPDVQNQDQVDTLIKSLGA